MKKALKIVIDTNIFLSILLGSKNCLKIRDAFLNGFFDIAISPKLLDELIDVTSKPKFSGFFEEKDIKELIKLLEIDSELVCPKEEIFACRDTEDNIVLECAVAGKVDCIVTGDKDLLELNSFRKIAIVTPSQFLKIISKDVLEYQKHFSPDRLLFEKEKLLFGRHGSGKTDLSMRRKQYIKKRKT